MNLKNLKWTKNISPQYGEPWAYQEFKAGHPFNLSWKENKLNASKPERADLILLRQKSFVTHLVEILDHDPEQEDWSGPYNIYRKVKVLWVIDWDNQPDSLKSDKLFGYPAVLKYQGGNAMKLEKLPTFKQHWNSEGGLSLFQEKILNALKLL